MFCGSTRRQHIRQRMARVWQGYGKGMARVWQGYGKGMARVWQGYGKGMARVWQGYCKGMRRVWQGYGKGMARVWQGYGTTMARGRWPELFPPSCGLCVVVGGRVAPPNGCLCPVPWVQTPVGGGYKAPGRLAPPAQQLARRRQAYSSSWCGGGGGRSGQCGARPLAWRPALRVYRFSGRRGLEPHVRAAPPLQGWDSGGDAGVRAGGRRAAAARTAHRRAPPPSVLAAVRKGCLGPHPRSLGPRPGCWGPDPGAVAPPPFGSCAREVVGRGWRLLCAPTHAGGGGGRRWELRPAWP